MEAKRKGLESIVNKPAFTPQAPQHTEEQKPADTTEHLSPYSSKIQ
jgi:hypothetical protein